MANADLASAHVDVRVAQRVQDLGHSYAVGFELVRVHLDLEFLRGTAPTVYGGDAGNRQQAARHDPILYRAQICDSEMRWTDNLITIAFASRAGTTNPRA